MPSLNMSVQRLKVDNPTTGLTLLWARNTFRGNFNHWQVSWKEAGQMITQGNETLFPIWQKESWHTFEETSGQGRI